MFANKDKIYGHTHDIHPEIYTKTIAALISVLIFISTQTVSDKQSQTVVDA
jgi:hypothetical protein